MTNGSDRDRRAKGEGTIWQEPDGRWRGQLDLGRGPDGKRLRPKVSGRNRTEVGKQLREIARRHRANLDTGQSPTVSELTEEWFAKAAPRTKAASTLDRLRDRLDGHLLPALGAMRVDKLRPDHVERWLADEVADGKALRTVQDYRGDLRQILGWAQRRRLVSWNVAAIAEVPVDARPPRERRSFTEAEAERLLVVLDDDRHGPFFTVLLLTGLRPGEAHGLQWPAVDLEARTMLTDRALPRGADGRPLKLAKTKTKTSRTVRLSDPVVAALKRQRVLQAEDRLAAGPGYSTAWSGHVFLNELGRPMNPSNVRRAFAALCQRAEVPTLTPYECRHSMASLAAAAGMDPWEVADLLGHKDLRMLERFYRHKLSPIAEGASDVTALLPGRQAQRRNG